MTDDDWMKCKKSALMQKPHRSRSSANRESEHKSYSVLLVVGPMMLVFFLVLMAARRPGRPNLRWKGGWGALLLLLSLLLFWPFLEMCPENGSVVGNK